MTDVGENGYLPYRKKKCAMSEEAAWAALTSVDAKYGFLGTHGVAAEGGVPYVVPMNFAADPNARCIYMHTTIDVDSKRNKSIEENPAVAFTVVTGARLIVPTDGIACRHSMRFESVMVFGNITVVEPVDEKARILNFLTEQKTGTNAFIPVQSFQTVVTTIYRLDVQHISGARKG